MFFYQGPASEVFPRACGRLRGRRNTRVSAMGTCTSDTELPMALQDAILA
jgi:hypothetical protein